MIIHDILLIISGMISGVCLVVIWDETKKQLKLRRRGKDE